LQKTGVTGCKLTNHGDAILFVVKQLGELMRFWSFIMLDDFVRKIEPLRGTRDGGVETLKAHLVELQLPFKQNTIEQVKSFFQTLELGKHQKSYHSKIQRVVIQKNTGTRTFKGRFVIPLKTERLKEELLLKYPKATKNERNGFFFDAPFHERKTNKLRDK